MPPQNGSYTYPVLTLPKETTAKIFTKFASALASAPCKRLCRRTARPSPISSLCVVFRGCRARAKYVLLHFACKSTPLPALRPAIQPVAISAPTTCALHHQARLVRSSTMLLRRSQREYVSHPFLALQMALLQRSGSTERGHCAETHPQKNRALRFPLHISVPP
ncbi:hypothetical protein MSAN_02382800 [Mycena sanguinolenta]|uniref:Uncharacterized protein n=1 Tax=Mycena sanguinolenta TaxID=230812 RepID=A0A8H6X4A2_9AGAR|nr:hypothetical protein MSAN_02382800 [Mycena sanguinolenta]